MQHYSQKFRLTYFWALLPLIVFFFSEDMRRTFVGEYAVIVDDMKLKYIVMLLSVIAMHIISPINIVSNNKFVPEANFFLLAFGTLLATTVCMQLNVGFHAESIKEFLFLLVPFVFVSCIVSSDSKVVAPLIDMCFYLSLFCYILTSIQILISGRSISDIVVNESYSPFENELSPYFVYFEIYYLFQKKRKLSLLCVFLTFLSLKRFCLLKAVLFYLLFSFTSYRKVDKRLYWMTIIAFILAPIFIEAIFRADNFDWIEDVVGQDIDQFTMSRYSIIRYVQFELEKELFGLGTTVYLLDDWMAKSMHCDILRIYWEGTILSTIVYTISFFKFVCKYNLFTYLIILNVFSEGLVNHWMLGAGISCQWIIIYLMIYVINRSCNKSGNGLVVKEKT